VYVTLGEKVGKPKDVGLRYGDDNFKECIPACGWEGECVQKNENGDRRCRCLPGWALPSACSTPAIRVSKISVPIREDYEHWSNFTLRLEEPFDGAKVNMRLYSNNSREARIKEKVRRQLYFNPMIPPP